MLSQNIKSFLLIYLTVLVSTISFSQCGISTFQSTITPTTTPQTTPTITSGKPYWEFAATAGCEYTFTTCSVSTIDTYLRLYNAAWTLVDLDDDDCSTQSTIVYTAPATGTYRILLTRWSCNDLSGSGSALTYSTNCSTATCSDLIQNQGETGVDCGGPCPACPVSCSDLIQNQGETGVDCGGPCPAVCPTCNDLTQNQGETGIDCGGPCAPCPVLCTDLGFENMATGANALDVTNWTLWHGRNNVPGPYTIESPVSSTTSCTLGSHPGCGSGVKVYNQNWEHHDMKGANPDGDALLNPPPLPNLSGSNTVCMRVGQNNTAGADAEGISTTFTVTEPYLAYHYILRFNNTGHDINNRGFATLRIKDAGGTVLPCGSFEVYEDGPGESWTYTTSGNDGWIMDQWKTLIVDVSSFIGQNMTIEVWVADCQEGAHAGWGYFDFECLPAAIADCSVAPLPVEFHNLSATCNDNSGVLAWTTASERDNSYFTIWESTDGIDFNAIGDVTGMGTSTSSHNYSFEIANYTNETKYYRVSQTDFNGIETIHETVSFAGCHNPPANVHYADGFVTVSGTDIYQISVVDAAGRLVKESNSIETKQKISIERLDGGIYFVAVYQKGMNPKTVKIFKH